jgi:hypothetical protein
MVVSPRRAAGLETAMRQDIHPSNLTVIDGAVFAGAYEGLMRRGTAAEWMQRWTHNHHAQVAIRAARDGEEGARFRAADGTVWHLRRAD